VHCVQIGNPLLPLTIVHCYLQLDILAGVKVSGRAQGDVLVDGRSRKHCRFQELCSYVQQKDVLVPSATVSSSSSSSRSDVAQWHRYLQLS
jgi:hypothetical protein